MQVDADTLIHLWLKFNASAAPRRFRNLVKYPVFRTRFPLSAQMHSFAKLCVRLATFAVLLCLLDFTAKVRKGFCKERKANCTST